MLKNQYSAKTNAALKIRAIKKMMIECRIFLLKFIRNFIFGENSKKEKQQVSLY